MKNKKKSRVAWYFLLIVILIYFFIYFFNSEIFYSSLDFFIKIFFNIYWIIILIFILMGLSNYFLTANKVKKYIGRGSNRRSWFVVIIFGILSMGPIYMWYPFLSDLNKKGMSFGLISCFLYNRAIKIPILPLMIFYFGIKYVFILAFVMIFMSVIQGVLINKIFEK
ncbi:hypothetical protein K9L16_01225 [Candidatus Pacearchaeota archaeon]|nr:hypothetical protein [Candidatus Pacearchaeota archaeon]